MISLCLLPDVVFVDAVKGFCQAPSNKDVRVRVCRYRSHLPTTCCSLPCTLWRVPEVVVCMYKEAFTFKLCQQYQLQSSCEFGVPVVRASVLTLVTMLVLWPHFFFFYYFLRMSWATGVGGERSFRTKEPFNLHLPSLVLQARQAPCTFHRRLSRHWLGFP